MQLRTSLSFNDSHRTFARAGRSPASSEVSSSDSHSQQTACSIQIRTQEFSPKILIEEFPPLRPVENHKNSIPARLTSLPRSSTPRSQNKGSCTPPRLKHFPTSQTYFQVKHKTCLVPILRRPDHDHIPLLHHQVQSRRTEGHHRLQSLQRQPNKC